ncbi:MULTISPECIES: zinc-binding alcohol dehydrogenase family protein [unclassified Microbacterium]|uniref:zinc-binding alcohol dehydrogenase family protein n=1 Tax=unclassified Microbacterium TaxID=2609290 RepID=UPI0030190F4F
MNGSSLRAAPAPAPSAEMRVWATSDAAGTLTSTTRRVPSPGADEVLIAVEACGVCRTDLHVIDREIPPHRPGVVPGHQVVGTVVAAGAAVRALHPGDRVGAAWLRRTCGTCRWCREGRENLCPASQYTGWDADGGFAEYLTAPESFLYRLPQDADPRQIAPLLCAGIIGYRALTRANLPPGGDLGIYGFGSSAHLTAQLAIAQGARVLAMTRGERNRELARRVGAVFVGDATAVPPTPVDAAIVFAPAGELVPLALEATRPGGTVVLAGIHMTAIPAMDYARDLFQERDLRTVTANTRADGAAFLRLAQSLRLTPRVTRYAFADTGAAIDELRSGRAAGSLVIGF